MIVRPVNYLKILLLTAGSFAFAAVENYFIIVIIFLTIE